MTMKAAARSFWRWFLAREEEFEPGAEPGFLDDLYDRLAAYCGGLTVELSCSEGGRRELIVSARGNTELFPVVDALIAEAPPSERWTFTALRPPLGFGFTSQHAGLELDPREMWFSPLTPGGKPGGPLGVRVGIPASLRLAPSVVSEVVWSLLETGLGERIAAEQVSQLETCELPADPTREMLPLTQLPMFLEWRAARSSPQEDT